MTFWIRKSAVTLLEKQKRNADFSIVRDVQCQRYRPNLASRYQVKRSRTVHIILRNHRRLGAVIHHGQWVTRAELEASNFAGERKLVPQAHYMAELVQEVPPQVWSETLLKSGFIHQHVAVVGLVGEKRASDQAWIFAGAVAQDEGGVFDFLDLSDLVK